MTINSDLLSIRNVVNSKDKNLCAKELSTEVIFIYIFFLLIGIRHITNICPLQTPYRQFRIKLIS